MEETVLQHSVALTLHVPQVFVKVKATDPDGNVRYLPLGELEENTLNFLLDEWLMKVKAEADRQRGKR